MENCEYNTNKTVTPLECEHENKLLNSLHDKSVVYILKVEDNDKHMIVKFAFSDDLVYTMEEQHDVYENCCLLDAFAVLRNITLEQDILSLMSRQKTMSPHSDKHLIFYKNGNGDGGRTYQEFKDLISSKISQYNIDPHLIMLKQRYEIEMLKLECTKRNISCNNVGVQCCLIDINDDNYMKSVKAGRGTRVRKSKKQNNINL
jgi:hypothetical protein